MRNRPIILLNILIYCMSKGLIYYKYLKVVNWDDHKDTSWILSHAFILILLPHWTWTHTGNSAWTKTPVSWASEREHQLDSTACRWGWQIRAGLTSPQQPRSWWWSWRRRRWEMLDQSDWPVSNSSFQKKRKKNKLTIEQLVFVLIY